MADDAPIHVKIIGTHPHAGEYGTIAVKNGKVTIENPLGLGRMVVVTLDDCVHGTESCYAPQKHLRLAARGEKYR